MLSPRNDDEHVENYPSGSRASVFKSNGSGFIYYPSGHVAVCKGVIEGRGRYYLYGDDQKSTPLGAVNEHAVGFFVGKAGIRLALNKVRATLQVHSAPGPALIHLRTGLLATRRYTAPRHTPAGADENREPAHNAHIHILLQPRHFYN